jgi:hypothetical protein
MPSLLFLNWCRPQKKNCHIGCGIIVSCFFPGLNHYPPVFISPVPLNLLSWLFHIVFFYYLYWLLDCSLGFLTQYCNTDFPLGHQILCPHLLGTAMWRSTELLGSKNQVIVSQCCRQMDSELSPCATFSPLTWASTNASSELTGVSIIHGLEHECFMLICQNTLDGSDSYLPHMGSIFSRIRRPLISWS